MLYVLIVILFSDIDGECNIQYTKDRRKCNAVYKHSNDVHNRTTITVTSKNCYDTLQAGLKYGGSIIASIVCAGILMVVLYKLHLSRKYRLEYAEFIQQQEENKDRIDNPLYNSPIRSYFNPIKMANDSEMSSFTKTNGRVANGR